MPPPCLFAGEHNELAIICRNYIISTCKKLLSAGVTSEFSCITSCPYDRVGNYNQCILLVKCDPLICFF